MSGKTGGGRRGRAAARGAARGAEIGRRASARARGSGPLPFWRCAVEAADGEARLEAACVSVGADLVVVVGGGARPHVGAAALAISLPSLKDPARPTESSSLLSVPGHKEEDLARAGALRLARALRRNVVVTVGIHDDAIPRARIGVYLELFERLVDAIVAEHAPSAGRGSPRGGARPEVTGPARGRGSSPPGRGSARRGRARSGPRGRPSPPGSRPSTR